MSIESNIANFAKAQERTAAALEEIVKLLSGGQLSSVGASAETLSTAAKAHDAETTPPPPPPAPEKEAAAPPPPPSLVVADAEECNALLVAEYNRMGGTPEVMQKIQALMSNSFGVRSVNELAVDQFGPLILKVREL